MIRQDTGMGRRMYIRAPVPESGYGTVNVPVTPFTSTESAPATCQRP
jgi:hypothetical protein